MIKYVRQVGGSLVSLEHQVIIIHASATSIALKVTCSDLAVGIVYTYQTTLHSERILLQGFHPNARSEQAPKDKFMTCILKTTYQY